jgi:predicted nucleic acid-binding protein
MNGDKYLADTNAFILLLAEHPSVESKLDSRWHYHFITEIELLGKPSILAREIGSIQGLLRICTRMRHNDSITATAISLRQRFKLKVPDALIAATAIDAKLPLLTSDMDFARIPALNLILLEL